MRGQPNVQDVTAPSLRCTRQRSGAVQSVDRAIQSIIGDEVDRWRVSVAGQDLTVALPFELPPEVEENLEVELMDLPGVATLYFPD